jgi:hypothetical protein
MADFNPERRGMMTASRAPKACNISPHGNSDTLMREMVREWHGLPSEFIPTPATRWGESHEANTVAEYEMLTGQVVYASGMEQVFVKHPHIDWLGGTPDGWIGEDGLLEVKNPWRARYSHWNQRPDIELQIRILLEVTGRKWCDLAIWYVEGLMPPSRIEHDDTWLRFRGEQEASVLVQLTRFMDTFHQIVESEERSAPFLKPLVNVRTDERWVAAEDWHNELLFIRDTTDAQIESSLTELAALAGDETSVRGPRGLLSQRTSSGSISYKDALAKYAPDADLRPFTTAPKVAFIWAYRRNKKES